MVDDIIKKNESILTQDFLDYAISQHFGELHMEVDPITGMKAIIAIHSTTLGPALGGCRFIPYPSLEDAIVDALRLARGMSYKSALANLPFGGGKSVIMKPQHSFDREGYFHAFGRMTTKLNGRYITALDSGTLLDDMDIIAQHTPYVASLSQNNGDPSPFTTLGILQGIKAAVSFKLGKDNLHDCHIAIQGLGHVGYSLARALFEAGAKLTVADIDPKIVAQAQTEFHANSVSVDTIHQIPCDVFSPCALGAVINDTSINQLQTSIVAGAANNQLTHSYHGQLLHDKDILYAPDYVINSGGLIFAACKYLHTSEEKMKTQITGIGDTLLTIFTRAQEKNCPPSTIADTLAQEKLGLI